MGWGAAAAGIGALGSIGGGLLGGSASKKAAKAQEEMNRFNIMQQYDMMNLQHQMFDDSRADQLKFMNRQRLDTAPWRISGANALMALNDMMGLRRPTAVSMGVRVAPKMPTGQKYYPTTLMKRTYSDPAGGPAANANGYVSGVANPNVARGVAASSPAVASGSGASYAAPTTTASRLTGTGSALGPFAGSFANPTNQATAPTAQKTGGYTETKVLDYSNMPKQWQNYYKAKNKYTQEMKTKPWELNNQQYLQASQMPKYDWQTSPGYDFRLDEGINALDRSAASRGRLLSGSQNRAVQKYGEGLAAEEYNNAFNRLAGIAGIGNTSATNTASMAGQTAGNINSGYNNLMAQYGQGAGNIGNALGSMGDARGSGYINQANAYGGMMNGLGNSLLYGLSQWGGGGGGSNPSGGYNWSSNLGYQSPYYFGGQ